MTDERRIAEALHDELVAGYVNDGYPAEVAEEKATVWLTLESQIERNC